MKIPWNYNSNMHFWPIGSRGGGPWGVKMVFWPSPGFFRNNHFVHLPIASTFEFLGQLRKERSFTEQEGLMKRCCDVNWKHPSAESGIWLLNTTDIVFEPNSTLQKYSNCMTGVLPPDNHPHRPESHQQSLSNVELKIISLKRFCCKKKIRN